MEKKRKLNLLVTMLVAFLLAVSGGPLAGLMPLKADAAAAHFVSGGDDSKEAATQEDSTEESSEAADTSGEEEPVSEEASEEATAAETDSENGEEADSVEDEVNPENLRGFRAAPSTRAPGITSWAALAAAVDAAQAGDTIELEGDLTADSTITIDKDITLAGNYTIYRDGSTQMGPMFKVEEGILTLDAGLTLSGKTAAGQSKTYKMSDIEDGTRGFFVEVGGKGKLVIDGATIRDYFTDGSRRGNRNDQPEGVSPIFVAGEFEMNSGSIVHNWASAVDRGANWQGHGQLADRNAPGAQFNIIRYNSALENEDGLDANGLGANFNGWDAIVKDGKDEVLEKTTAGAIFIDAPGKTSTINGGNISDNAGHAGAIAVAGGTLVINDGTIGATGTASRPDGRLGSFNNNESQGNWGDHFGTVYVVSSDAEVRMCGGTIKNNTTVQGGGVFVTNDGTFFLMGGSIDGNNTMGNGGGLLIYSDKVYLLKGEIKNNIAPVFGGGIYVYGDDMLPAYQYTTTIHNAEITNNTALEFTSAFLSGDRTEVNDDAFRRGSGGGIWLCPAGTVEFDASTINLYGNNALREGEPGQGKDFHKDAGFEGGVLIDFGPHTELAESADDEGDFVWYHDELRNDKNGKPLTVEEATSGEAGRLSIYNKTNHKNVEKPTLFITNNTSRRGGGIGADGSVLFINPTEEDKNIDKGRLGFEKEFVDMEEKPMEYEMVLADAKGNPDLDDEGNEVIISIFRLFDKEWADNYEANRKKATIDSVKNEYFGQLAAYWPDAMEKDDLGVWRPKDGTTDADYSNVQMNFPSGQHGINYFDPDNPDLTIILREYSVNEQTKKRGPQVSSQIFRSTDPDFAGEPIIDLDKEVVIYPGPDCDPAQQGCDGCNPGEPTAFDLKYRTFPFSAKGTNEEKPEIEKYINEAVHSDISIKDEFTYNILAYVTTDADEMVVTDKLDNQLKFASNDVSKVKVYDLGMTTDRGEGLNVPIDSNHLPVYDVSGDSIDNGDTIPSVKTGTAITIRNSEYSKVEISDQTLTVKLANKLNQIGTDPETQKPIFENATDEQELTDLRGHWIRIEFKAKLSDAVIAQLESGDKLISELVMEEIKADNEEQREEPNVGNDPVKSDEDHKGIINNASYKIKVKNEAKYEDKSNTVTVKPEEPEIEKYVSEAVHDNIAVDEVFTYDILAYVANDADKVVITDELNEQLEMVSTADKVSVVDLGTENNHKVINNVEGTEVNNDATVALAGQSLSGKDGVSVKIEDGKKLTVTLDDNVTVNAQTGTKTREHETVKKLRGHWVKVTFQAQIKKELQNRINAGAKPEDVLDYVEIKADEAYKPDGSIYDGDETRPAPNTGNDPVDSDEDHKGIENTASYKIEVGNKAKYEDESNTVTVKPEKPEIEKYVSEAVHDFIDVDEIFTYSILAYVTEDADKVVIKDKLVDDLEFADPANVKIASLADNNHKVTNDVDGVKVNGDASVAEDGTPISEGEGVTVSTTNGILTVTLDDGITINEGTKTRDRETVKNLRGKWVKVTFDAQIKAALQERIKNSEKPSDVLTYAEIKANEQYKPEDSIYTGDDETRPEANVGNDPVKSDEDHEGVENTASYEIYVGNDSEYKDESNTVTVKPDKPEIEKYVSEAVHDNIKVDEVFTYNILAYITEDADKVVIEDELVSDLEFAPGTEVSVAKLDSSNHKVSNNVDGIEVNSDASVAETGEDITNADGVDATKTDAGKLTVTLDDGVKVSLLDGTKTRKYDTVKNLRGSWVKVTFQAQIKQSLQDRINAGAKPEDVLTYVEIKDADEEERTAPNKGNDPVISGEDHKGIENKAKYTISVGNDAKHRDESNKVTVKPEKPEIEKYVSEAVHDFIDVDEVFTYSILAYITEDADKAVIKDKLVDDLEFADPANVKVESLDDNNHKVTNDVAGKEVNTDASVAEAGTDITSEDGVSISTDDGELVVTLDDKVTIDKEAGTKSREYETVKGLRGKWVKVTFDAQIKKDLQDRINAGEKPEDVLKYAEIKASENYMPADSIYKDGERPMPNVGNAPVDSDEDHDGVENTANYEIFVNNEAEYKDESNTVTVKPEVPEIEKYVNKNVHRFIGLDDTFTYDILAYVTEDADEVEITDTLVDDLEFVSKAGSIEVVDLGETVDHKPNGSVAEKGKSVKSDAEIKGQTLTITIADATPHRGHWVKATFEARLAKSKADDIKSGKISIDDLKNADIKNGVVLDEDDDRMAPNEGNLPVITDEEHSGVPNTSSYRIKVGNEYKYEDKSNTVTVKPEKPEIEKYINKAVHKEVKMTEAFVYDIIAYVTRDADTVTITDKLHKDLEFVSSSDGVKVVNLGEDNNHKVVNDIYAKPVDGNEDATVASDGEEVENAEISISGRTLKVEITDATALRGCWVKVTFNARIAKGRSLNSLKYTKIKASAKEDREAPNVGNDPLTSKEDHLGIPNTASYDIGVRNEAGKIEKKKYSDVSNTVTVKPKSGDEEVDNIDDGGEDDVNDENDVSDKRSKTRGVNTGDQNLMVAWCILLALAAAAVAFIAVRKKRH